MDFSRVELSDDDQAFLDEARTFLTDQVTDDVIRRDRETGDNFDEGVHLALGAAGYLAAGVEDRGRRRVQPRARPTVATREATRPRAVGDVGHHRDDRQVGGQVRVTPNSATK